MTIRRNSQKLWDFFVNAFAPLFFQSYIPKTLDSVKNAEGDVIRLTTGDMYYKTITELKETLSEALPTLAEQENQPEPNGAKDSSLIRLVMNLSPVKTKTMRATPKPSLWLPLTRELPEKRTKRRWKEEKREARKTKVPKAVKTRKKKLSKAHKTR